MAAADPWGPIHHGLGSAGVSNVAATTAAAITPTPADLWAADMFLVSDDETQHPAAAQQDPLPVDVRTGLPIKNPLGLPFKPPPPPHILEPKAAPHRHTTNPAGRGQAALVTMPSPDTRAHLRLVAAKFLAITM